MYIYIHVHVNIKRQINVDHFTRRNVQKLNQILSFLNILFYIYK